MESRLLVPPTQPGGGVAGEEVETRSAVLRALRLYFIAVMGLAALASVVVLVRSVWLHESYPYNTLLFIPGVRFSDFTDNYTRMSHFGTPEFFSPGPLPFTYLAASAYAFLFFIRLSSQPFMFYLAAAGMYLLFTSMSEWGFAVLQRRLAIGIRQVGV